MPRKSAKKVVESVRARTGAPATKRRKPATPRKSKRRHPATLIAGDRGMSAKRTKELMRDVDVAWVQDRLAKMHRTQRDLASAWGAKSASAVTRVLHNNRDLKIRELLAMCAMLKCSADVLLYRLGYDFPEGLASVGITGAVTDGARVTYVTQAVGQHVELKPLDGGLSALLCEAKTGALAAYQGAIILYTPTDRTTPVLDRLAIVEVAGEVVPLLGVLSRGAKADSLRLTRFGSGEAEDVETIIRTHPVHQIILQ